MAHNVAHFLAEQAHQNPDNPGVRAPVGLVADGVIRYESRSFAELEAEVSATAHLLNTRGIVRGTRVLLMVKPGLDLIGIVFALFKIGAVPVVIDPGMGLKGFLRCVRHSQPEAVVGIPMAIWLSRIFRGSFKGAVSKVSVGGDQSPGLGFCLSGHVSGSRFDGGRSGGCFVYFGFDGAGKRGVLYAWNVGRPSGSDSGAIPHRFGRDRLADAADLCLV